MPSLELEIVTKLKARLEELRQRSRDQTADGICMRSGVPNIPFEYGYAMGYLRHNDECLIIVDEIAQDVLKGEG